MSCPYKVSISNKNLYREFQIDENVERISLGTTSNCEFRINKDDYFDTIEITFVKTELGWQVLCGDSIYLSAGDIRKLGFSKIKHGDKFIVKYASNGIDVFELSFAMDFEAQIPVFNQYVNINELSNIKIGDNKSNDFVLKSQFCVNTTVSLVKDKEHSC